MDCNSAQTLDAKGRVIIPARYREQTGDTVAVMRGDGGCLYVYSQKYWEEQERPKLEAMAASNVRANRQVRMIFMTMASGLEMDKQGRLLLPPALRKFAQLEKDIVVAGSHNKLEIWDQKLFDEFIEKVQSTIDEDAEANDSDLNY